MLALFKNIYPNKQPNMWFIFSFIKNISRLKKDKPIWETGNRKVCTIGTHSRPTGHFLWLSIIFPVGTWHGRGSSLEWVRELDEEEDLGERRGNPPACHLEALWGIADKHEGKQTGRDEETCTASCQQSHNKTIQINTPRHYLALLYSLLLNGPEWRSMKRPLL